MKFVVYFLNAIFLTINFFILEIQCPGNYSMPSTSSTPGSSGGSSKGINLAPPPTPQAILPPKPIIVAPMIIKKNRKRRKVAVYYSGPTMPTWDGQVPHVTNASGYGYANSLPLRKLITYPNNYLQNVNFRTASQDVPGYLAKLHAVGEDAKMSLHPFFATELEGQEGKQGLGEYGDQKKQFEDLSEKVEELKEEVNDLQSFSRQEVGDLEGVLRILKGYRQKAKGIGYGWLHVQLTI